MGRIAAGQLRERVTLLTTAGAASDGRGGYTPSGPDVSTTVWARVRPLSAREKLQLGQVVNSAAYEITIRKLDAAAAKKRVLWKGETLNVQAVVADEDREYQRLTCFNGGQ